MLEKGLDKESTNRIHDFVTLNGDPMTVLNELLILSKKT